MVRQGPVEQSRWPAVDTFARAIETSDFDRHLKNTEAELPACAPEADAKCWTPSDEDYSTYAREFAADSR